MYMARPVVVLGLLGSTLDAGLGGNRWNRWRPTVSIGQHDDLLVRRFELLFQPANEELARTVARDLVQVSPETQVRLKSIEIRNAWDFEEVYSTLHEFARTYPFHPDREDYLV